MMSKKNYQAIAMAIHDALYVADDKELFVAVLTDIMATDNPRFDRGRFMEACETGTTRGMRK
jgi:hypothetical protein